MLISARFLDARGDEKQVNNLERPKSYAFGKRYQSFGGLVRIMGKRFSFHVSIFVVVEYLF